MDKLNGTFDSIKAKLSKMQLSILVKLNAGIDLFKQYFNLKYCSVYRRCNCVYRCFAAASSLKIIIIILYSLQAKELIFY